MRIEPSRREYSVWTCRCAKAGGLATSSKGDAGEGVSVLLDMGFGVLGGRAWNGHLGLHQLQSPSNGQGFAALGRPLSRTSRETTCTYLDSYYNDFIVFFAII